MVKKRLNADQIHPVGGIYAAVGVLDVQLMCNCLTTHMQKSIHITATCRPGVLSSVRKWMGWVEEGVSPYRTKKLH